MAISKDINFNKNVVMVYTEEIGFTGYKALEDSKITNLEQQTSGIYEKVNEINQKIQTTGDLYTGILVHQADLNSIYDNVDIGGYAGTDISGLNNAVLNNFPVYTSIELKYDGSSNTTGVFYKIGETVVREIKMMYNGSNVTGIFKTDY
jgi:hypothetical protein